MQWWIWAICAVGVALVELHWPGAYFIWFALALALTATVEATWTLSLQSQLFTFLLSAALSCVLGFYVYRFLRDRPDESDTLNRRDQQMIGARGAVCNAIVNGQGKVRIGDTVWLADGPDLADGTPVIVRSVRGARLRVDADG